jgi:hypothetical protein
MNMEAQCSATASPFAQSATTVSQTLTTIDTLVSVSTYQATLRITQPASTATLTAVSTVRQTATQTSMPTTDSNATAPLPSPTLAHSGLSKTDTILVGVFSGIGGALLLAFLFWIWRWWRARREDAKNKRAFAQMEQGGSFRQLNTARMQQNEEPGVRTHMRHLRKSLSKMIDRRVLWIRRLTLQVLSMAVRWTRSTGPEAS